MIALVLDVLLCALPSFMAGIGTGYFLAAARSHWRH